MAVVLSCPIRAQLGLTDCTSRRRPPHVRLLGRIWVPASGDRFCLPSRAPPVARGQREVQRVALFFFKGVTALSFLWCFARCAKCLITLFHFRKKKIVALRASTRANSLYEEKKNTTLSGGSLGSCVDEERSQLRELM